MIEGRQALLLINGVPYAFQESWILDEQYTKGGSVQESTTAGTIPLVVPMPTTLNISINVCMGNQIHNAIYATAKQVIKISQLFTTAYTNSKNTNLLVPYTNLVIPPELGVSCAYLGLHQQMACCFITNFSTSLQSGTTNEIWEISLTEYDIRKFDKAKSTTQVPQPTNLFVPEAL